jgi:hypothetical protein
MKYFMVSLMPEFGQTWPVRLDPNGLLRKGLQGRTIVSRAKGAFLRIIKIYANRGKRDLHPKMDPIL